MGEKHLAKVINYERDIKPYRFIKIYSGVGSGKSTFACRFATGCDIKGEAVPKLTTLIITSRRAKVEETLAEMGAKIKAYVGQRGNLTAEVFETGEERPEEYEEYVRIIPSDEKYSGDIVTHNMSVVCTNAYIENYLRYSYNPSDTSTHLWNLFDVIIIDEVHSLITDATYQSAPFAVLELIQEYIRRCSDKEVTEPKCKHLIVMTGSPEPFEAYAGLTIPEEIGTTYSLFDECINVVPNKVVLLNGENAKRKLHKILKAGNKAVYFSNHVVSDRSKARGRWHLNPAINIGVSYSDEDRRKALDNAELAAIETVEEELKSGRLPDDLQLFVTTSRNKEGINIKNTDIRHMFVEAHFASDVIQMAGRVRYGLDCLYIVTDEEPLCKGADEVDIAFTRAKIVQETGDVSNPAACGDVNSYLATLCEEHKIRDLLFNRNAKRSIFGNYKETLGAYVKYIEERFPYVRYSFIDNRFKFYQQKMDAEHLIDRQNKEFLEAVTSGKEMAAALIKRWFPTAEVEFVLTAKERAIEYLDHYIGETGYKLVSSKDWKNLFNELQRIAETDYKENNRSILTCLGDYHLTNPIHDNRIKKLNGKIGAMVLYKGKSPLDTRVPKRDPSKRAKTRANA